MQEHSNTTHLHSNPTDSEIVPSKFSGRLIVHVGPHKTGTTTIQSFWQSNPALLRGSGFLYPEGGRNAAVPIQHWAFGEALIHQDIPRVNGMIQDIDLELTAGNFETLLLSTEILSRKAVLACHLELLCRVFPEAKRQWMVVLRRQDELVPSLYSEHLKHALIKYPETYLKISIAEHLDHVRRLELIAQASPADEILVARFDDIKDDMVGNFNMMFGLGAAKTHSLTNVKPLNTSIPGKALRIVRYINALPARAATPIRGRFISFSRKHERWFKGDPIDPAQVAAVQRQYLAGNLAIERALFPNLGARLFIGQPDPPLESVTLSADLTARLRGWDPEQQRFFPPVGESPHAKAAE